MNAPVQDNASSRLMRAVEAQNAGRIDAAESLFRAVLADEPADLAARFAAHYSLGAILANRQDQAEALTHLNAAVAGNPAFAPSYLARAQILKQLDRPAEALADTQMALRLDVGLAVAQALGAELLGVLAVRPPASAGHDCNAPLVLPQRLIDLMAQTGPLAQVGRMEAVLALYEQYAQTGGAAHAYVGYFNAGVQFSQAERKLEAESCFRRSLVLRADFLLAHLNLGIVLEGNGRPGDAAAQWQQALSLPAAHAPENAALKVQLSNTLGRLLEVLREYEGAEQALQASLSINPDQPQVIHHWVHLRQKMCRWPVIHGIARTAQQVLEAASPLAMLGLSDDPAEQLASAQRFVDAKVGRFERMVARTHRYGHERIRIGYLSSDLSTHAVSLLTVQLFEKHNRDRVEVHAFCWSKEDGTAFRQRVRRAFDRYHPIGHLDDAEAAELIRQQEIDVLVDLHGLTSNARPNIVARGPAPVQVAYLGFPGPTALPHMDYVVADDFLFPKALEPHFTEAPLRLPTLFQCSDSQREIGSTPTRTELGLPESAFVFCAFNNNFKFTPEMFGSWMRILRGAPHSVLWLLEDNPWSRSNLRAAAMAHGIDPDRLVFAGRVLPADYLARFRAADLFLDTSPYNAGTTANDALWAGLPLLTLSGRTYVSRMAGSLLTSAGLPELITFDEAAYERQAIRCAIHPAEMQALRQRLADRKVRGGLFDTGRFCEEFEGALWDELYPGLRDSLR